ncbi:mycofactocin-coupled SDR family oxidoreductase [Gordonia terrae]
MGRLDGRAALVTGAARGQGRSHAVRLAEEGADIIALDICDQVASADHTLATESDLEETVALVEKLDRRVFAIAADVRNLEALENAVSEGVSELGRLDIVSANAGIVSIAPMLEMSAQTWQDVIDINLTGVFNTVKATAPHIIAGNRGGSIILTSSAGAVTGAQNLGHYVAAKQGVLGLMKTLALELGQFSIRVNSVLPGTVDTPMIVNDRFLRLFMPHLEHPTRDDAELPDSSFSVGNILPVPWVNPVDISNAVLYLASDEARYVTGVALPVDAGFILK